MANLSSAEHIAHLVDVMNSAAENLIKHQGQAERVRTKATRTTVVGLLCLPHAASLLLCLLIIPVVMMRSKEFKTSRLLMLIL